MSDKILLVDDDTNALATYRRNLRRDFSVDTASSGAEGLEAITLQGPFAVVVSDLRMPGMDGVEFLTQARQCAPDSVLMMLTGHTDLQTAFDALNEGVYFRFLIKPCTLDALVKALKAGIAQYRLLIAERELLEKTLRGSIEVLTEILAMVNARAFGRAARVKSFAQDIAVQMHLPNLWQIEVAAMLSQVGCVALPAELLTKAYAGENLSKEEQETFDSHPTIGANLVAGIPRLDLIARMIEDQRLPYKMFAQALDDAGERAAALGAQILKVAVDLDQGVAKGLAPRVALAQMEKRPGEYNPEVIKALWNAKGTTASLFAH